MNLSHSPSCIRRNRSAECASVNHKQPRLFAVQYYWNDEKVPRTKHGEIVFHRRTDIAILWFGRRSGSGQVLAQFRPTGVQTSGRNFVVGWSRRKWRQKEFSHWIVERNEIAAEHVGSNDSIHAQYVFSIRNLHRAVLEFKRADADRIGLGSVCALRSLVANAKNLTSCS